MKTMGLALVLSGLATLGQAATVTYDATFSSTQTDSQDRIVTEVILPGFDPSLGTYVSSTVTVEGTFSATYGVECTDSRSGCEGDYFADTDVIPVDYTGAGVVIPESFISSYDLTATQQPARPARDTVVITDETFSISTSETTSAFDPEAPLSIVIQAGLNDVNTGGSDLSVTSVSGVISGTASVTYEYIPAVPLPASAVLLFAALGGLAWTRARAS